MAQLAQLGERKRPFPFGTFVVVTAALITGTAVVQRISVQPRTDDAEVFANFIGIAPVVEGPVTKLAVQDNQLVKQGDLLYEIDDAPYRYALQNALSQEAALEGQIANEERHIASQGSAAAAAKAASQSAEAAVLEAEATIQQERADVGHSEAQLNQATVEYEYANNNLHRLEPLLSQQFVTVDQLDQARSSTRAREEAVKQAAAQLKLSQARLNSALAQKARSTANVEQSQAQVIQSQRAIDILEPLIAQRGARAAAVDTARYNLDHCRVYAPFDARVTNLTSSEGAYAHIGQQLFTLIDVRNWWVIANYRETQLKKIVPGMKVDVWVMSNSTLRLKGVVDSTGYGVVPDPAIIGSITSGLPDAQRTLNWVHLASRYPVRIRILDPGSDLLRVGENAVAIVRGNPAARAR
jgi:membrane fusion protein, multidrug efflux system